MRSRQWPRAGKARRWLACVGLFAAAVALAIGVDAAWAAGSNSSAASLTSTTFLSWATGPGSIDWSRGAALAGLGLVGALVEVYVSTGEALPSIGGQARISGLQARLSEEQAHREDAVTRCEQLAPQENVSEQFEQFETVAGLRQDSIRALSRELATVRRQQTYVGVPVYLLLGAFFASAVATNLLQALLVGFGWTAVLGRLGLRQDKTAAVDQAKSIDRQRQEQLAALEKRLAAYGVTVGELTRQLAERAGSQEVPQ